MAADPLAERKARYTQSTQSKTRVDHTYVAVAQIAQSAVLRHRRGEGEWVESGSGKVTTCYIPSEGTYCIRLGGSGGSASDGGTGTSSSNGKGAASDNNSSGAGAAGGSNSEGGGEAASGSGGETLIRISSGTDYSRSGEKTVAWTEAATGAEMELEFNNVTARDTTLTVIRKVVVIADAIADTDGRAAWFEAFATEDQLGWSRFFGVAQRWAATPLTDVQDSLKAVLSSPAAGGNVTPEVFSNFLKWFGPFNGAFAKWRTIRGLSYFHGNMQRDSAEEALTGKPAKSFILRFSEPGFFAVSYVAADGAVLHFRIENTGPTGFAMLTADDEVLYEATVNELLARQLHILDLDVAVEQMPFANPSSSQAAADDSALTASAKSSAPVEPVEFLGEGWLESITLLCQSEDADIKLQAASMIVGWVEVEDNKVPFCRGGGVPLVTLLAESTADRAIQRLAVRALCALVAAPKCKMTIVDQALPALFSFAASNDEQIQQYAAFIFANLVLNDIQIQQILLERGSLAALNDLAKSASSYVQANIAWVFGNLAQHETNKKPILLGGLQSLFMMAQSENEKVKKYAFDALGCLGIVDGDDVGKLIAQVKASLDPKPVWEIDYSQIDDLVLVDSGGYGNVYVGKYLHMKVAVKLLKKSQLRDLEAFKLEIATMSKLRHPNVVLFLGATTNPLTIVTEYMARKSLFDVIHDHSVDLHSRLVLKMARDVSLGMSYLHSLNIIHRDLKSLNLLVDENFNIKIADFGLSRVISFDTTMTPHGTYAWRPPEMFRTEAYDHRVDVYSFGVVLWELVSRDIPFDGLSYEDIKKAVLGGRRPAVRSTSDAIFEEIIGLMKACWQDNPNLRPSFDDICVGLEEVAAAFLAP